MTPAWSDGALLRRVAEAPGAPLSRLPPARRRRLAERIASSHADPASLAERLAHPEAAEALLPRLDPDALCAAHLLVEAVEPIPHEVLLAEAMRRGQAEAMGRGLAILEEEGLLLRLSWTGGAEVVQLAPPLSRTFGPYLWMLDRCRAPSALAVTTPARRASIALERARDLALVLAAAAADAPRIPREGGVHGADVARLCDERFAAGTDPETIAARLSQLVAMGLLEGHGSRARVAWARVEAFFALSAGARLSLLLSTDRKRGEAYAAVPGLSERQEVRGLLAAALAALPGGIWARGDALAAAVRLRLLATDAATPYRDGEAALVRSGKIVQQEFVAMRLCLEGFGREGKDPEFFRLPRGEEGEPDAAWIVQPTHEVLVPPELPPGGIVTLASVATLQRADTVSIFRIEPESIARARAAGLDHAEIFDRVALGAEHEPPATLSMQIDDWLIRPAKDSGPDDRESVRAREVPAHLRFPPPPIPAPLKLAFLPAVARMREALGRRLAEHAPGPGRGGS